MYANRLTVGTTNYDLVSQMPYRSIRANAARPVSSPATLTIAHEETKSGVRNSVIVLDDSVVLNNGTTITKDTIKAQLKLSFKPLSGRADVEAVLSEMINTLTAFISVPENLDKFLNKES